MARGLPLAEQLDLLGVSLPTWPQEATADEAESIWISSALDYVEVIGRWRSQLQQAPAATRAVVQQLVGHLEQSQQLQGWDQLVMAVIGLDQLPHRSPQTREHCRTLLRQLPLSPAQLLGVSLELAGRGQLHLASRGISRLLEIQPMAGDQLVEVVGHVVAAVPAAGVTGSGGFERDAWSRAVALQQELVRLLALVLQGPEDPQLQLMAALKRLEASAPQFASAALRPGPPVSLTTISGRLETLPAVVNTLREQSLKPARLHLHLSEEPHLLDGGVARDHPVVVALQEDPWVELHWVANLGPYRKVVPYLAAGGYGSDAGGEDLFITVDDDTLYPPRFIDYLMRQRERHGCIVAHRGRLMRLAAGGCFQPYGQWHDGLREPRLANLPTGQSGVIYRRSDFPNDLELEAALALAPTHDDLWLRWLTARQGVAAVILQPNAAANTQALAFPSASALPAEEQPSLWFAYNAPEAAAGSRCGNDGATTAIASYFQARGFDLAARLKEEQEEYADWY